jgi:WD40 repeat protein
LQIWHAPSIPGTERGGELEFAPFVLHLDLAGHFDAIQNIEWSSDSRFLLTASKDLTVRVWSLDREDGFEPTTLAGHRHAVKAAYFTADQESVSLQTIMVLRQPTHVPRYIQLAKMAPFTDGNMSPKRVAQMRRRRTKTSVGG